MNIRPSHDSRLGRRAFLKGGTLLLTAGWVAGAEDAGAADPGRAVRFGVVTDLHYADKPTVGTRYYRETPAKLVEAMERYRRDEPDFLVELGDFIDTTGSVEGDLRDLARIDRDFSAIKRPRYYVLGNHCVDTLTKQEFLGQVAQERSYFSFDKGGHHFIVLDACFRRDGEPYGRDNSDWRDSNLPPEEVRWLREDLAATSKPSIVFIHQRLDVPAPYGINNAVEVRKILEDSRKVLAVFQGHSHKNDHHEIGGVHYVTQVAMIEGSGAENSGFSTVDVNADGSIRIQGFRRQKSYDWLA